MKLADWLVENKVKRVDFAKEIGVQPSVITAWCSGKYAITRDNAVKVFSVTKGQVTPNDFFLPDAGDAA